MSSSFKTTAIKLLASTIFTSSLIYAAPVIAQDDDEAKSRYAIDEIVTTARRIEESLQDAPLAVTALSGVDLENRGAVDVIDFADVAPNVNFKSGGNISGFGAAPVVTIRGVGQSDFVINTDPAVGIYTDGVYLGRSIGSVLDLVDVERVEALRGPQGTLFGRNSIGGAINVISKKPDTNGGFGGSVSAAFGEEGYIQLNGGYNLAFSDDFAVRISGMHRERDGFIEALVYDDLDLGAENVDAVRVAARWQPTDQLTVDLDADYSDRNDSGAPNIPVLFGDLGVFEDNTTLTISGVGDEAPGLSSSLFARRFNGEPFQGPPPLTLEPLAGGPFAGNRPEFVELGFVADLAIADCTIPAIRDTSPNCLGNFYAASVDGGTFQTYFDENGNIVEPDQELDAWGFGGRLAYEHEHFTLKTITSFRGFDASFFNSSPAPIFIASNNNDEFSVDQFSQEVTLEGSSFGDRLDWIIGGFYFTEDGNQVVTTVFPLAPPSFNSSREALPFGALEDRNIDNESVGGSGQLSFNITDSLTLTGGLRITNETKEVDTAFSTINIDNETVTTPFVNELDITEENFLVNLSWEATDDTLLYAQFSDGFRSGGFPARTPPGTDAAFFEALSYDPEFVDSYEIGAKTTLFGGAVRANLALFRSEYTDQQINATADNPVSGPVLAVANLADSIIQGAELEANWLVTDDFRIDASVGYLDTELDEILDPSGTFILNDNSNIRRDITADDDIELPNAPEWQISVGANYSFYLGDAEVRNRLDLVHESSQNSSIGNYNFTQIPSTTRLNYFLTYIPTENYEFTLGARNLTDEEDVIGAALATGPGAVGSNVIRRGREAFAQLKVKFGENY